MKDLKNIAVIGSGTMGNGIAHVAAQSNLKTILIDIDDNQLNNAMKTISNNLDRQINKNIISTDEKENTLSNISLSTNISDCKTLDLVIEAVPEKYDLKASIFKNLDKICNDNTIFASNTSSISISSLGEETNRPEKVIGMHFMNPVPIMKLVEIINGEHTSQEVTSLVVEAAENMGKTALACQDSPGFVSNRILCPMINEAILTLQEGVAEPEAIDGIMKLGMNHPIGPLALSDLIGNDTVLHIMNVLYDGFKNEKYAPAKLLVEMVEKGELGRKSGKGFYQY